MDLAGSGLGLGLGDLSHCLGALIIERPQILGAKIEIYFKNT